MKKHQGPVAFISVSDLIREKSINYNRNLPMETGVISTSFMAPDSENVKDSHGDDLDCFDEDCGYSPADWRVKPGNKTIINSSQTATSQFSENSSLRHPPPLACQLTPGRTKSPKLQSQVTFFHVIYSQQICRTAKPKWLNRSKLQNRKHCDQLKGRPGARIGLLAER